MRRSFLAVVAGSFAWMVTALGSDFILMSLAPHWFKEGGKVESVPVLLLMLSYSLAFSILGGYVAAFIARRKEVTHAFALGVVQLAMGIVATIKFFDTAPLWWHVALLALLVPANVLGGLLRGGQRGKAAPRPLRAA